MTRMKFSITSLFLLLMITASAQDWSTTNYKYGEQYPGYVVDLDGQKLIGFIKYRNRNVMQKEVIFYSEKDNPSTKKKYKAKDLREYKVADKLYHCIPYAGSTSDFTFHGNLVVEGEGCIKQYVWYDCAPGYTTMKKLPGESDKAFGERKFPSKKVFFKDGDGAGVTKEYFKDGFPKKMATYVSSNKALAKKVKSKQPGYAERDMKKVIEEYNGECSK